jgi:RNA polymerase sigma-70 factor (ECF subfamily)
MIIAAGVMDNEQVYRNYSQELTRYATGLVGPFDASDVVTDACLRAFDSPSWPDVVDRRAYLYRTVFSVATDHHRRTLSRRLREIRSASPEAIETTPADVDVLRAVSNLSVSQRAAVFLTYWEDLRSSEVADRMGISEGAAKRHLARARKRLGELLR